MSNKSIPEAFHPGEYIKLALEGKGWIQLDLAAVMDKPANVISDIIGGRRPITPEIATELGIIFGNGAQVWLNLQTAYELAKSRPAGGRLERRKQLFEIAPIREMQKRGWIETSSSVEVLEAQCCQFFGIKNISDEISIAHAARKSDDYKSVSSPQLAWLHRAKQLAEQMVTVPKYKDVNLEKVLSELSEYLLEPESVSAIPELLRCYGIRFLVVEALPRTKIDGACFWLNNNSPVVVLSMRYDRIDYFWHTLLHELMHIHRRDGQDILLIETAMAGDDAQPDEEKLAAEVGADLLARKFLVNQDRLQDFVLRHKPMFSRVKIRRFARLIGVHPGIVVGQLQYAKEIPYRNFRAMLVKVRDILTSTAITDGWGNVITN